MSRLASYTRRSCSPAIGLALWLLSAGVASAQQSDFSLKFATETAHATTAMHLQIVYRNPAAPNGKPSPIRHLVTMAPFGTRFNLTIPRCTASDQEIMAQGPSACPAGSQVGTGTLTAITGFGPPIDPYPTDVTIFNTGEGVVEIVRDQRTGATLADDRLQIKGNAMIGNPPAIPGGPPDGQTAVREIDFTFPASSHYITTPPSCPGGVWTSNASFTFADGTTQHVASATPCRPSADSGGHAHSGGRTQARIRVAGVPRRCARRAFTARVRIRDRSALKLVQVRLDGRLMFTTRRKRFGVRIHARSLRPGRHRLSVIARDAAGNRARKTVRFWRCG